MLTVMISGAGTIFSLGGQTGASMEGSRARRRGSGVWEGRRSPSPVWESGGYAPENFSKVDVKMAYFSAFLQAEMDSSAVVSMQD